MKSRLMSALVIPLLVLGLVTGCKSSTSASGGGQGASASQSSTDTGSTPTGSSSGSSTDCPTSNTTNFAKTKFVLHAGLAFGAFHRYIYKPFKAGSFQSGAHGRILALGKAGVSALFIKREVRLAAEDVKANPTLCKAIAAPLQDIGDHISDAVSSLKSGDVTAITGLEKTVQSIKGKAASSGNTIQEDPNAPLK